MSDLLAAVHPVVSAFDTLGVTYRIGGSVASSALGVSRTTMDVDIVTDLQLPQATDLVRTLGSAYYSDLHMIEEAVRHVSSFNLIHLETMVKIDVFILKPRTYDQACFRRFQDHSLVSGAGEELFHLLCPEDVILTKLEWYRSGGEVSERQWRDVLGVLRVQRHLDTEWMQHWAAVIGVVDLLHRAVEEAASPG